MLSIIDKLNFYLYKFWGFLKPRRKLGLVSFIILSSLILVVWVASTNVAHADILPTMDEIGRWIAGILLTIAGYFLKLTFFILKFVIEVGGYNGFIDSPAVTVGWVMVRDITNMVFVVVLLIISFGTILGLEQYEYKKLLVKLLMAAVIVNFSRIISGIIIDVAQVVMITFINGIAATASGNLINMFQLGEIFKLNGDAAGLKQPTGGEAMLAGIAAITFAAMMMMTMLTFLFLLLARMMALWILIVLSPFAFVLNVLPQTQKYAGQWWSEFGGNVVAGPVIAFFLWLSFVTVGAGNANEHIAADNPHKLVQPSDKPEEVSTGLSSIMSWEKMANFAIAIGMLLAGAKMAQQLGAAGGSMMGKAGEFGKKVAMVASGASAARFVGGKAWAGIKAKAPIIGTESMARKWRTVIAIGGRIKKSMPVVGDIARTKGAKWLGKSGEKAWEAGKEARGKAGIWNKFKGYGLAGLGAVAGKTVGKVAEGVVETTARAEKRVKKREDLVKELEKAEELEMGFSETALGKTITKQQAANKVREDKKEIDKTRALLNAQADRLEDLGDFVKANLIRQQAATFEFNKLQEVFKAAGANANERANISGALMSKMKMLTDKKSTTGLSSDEDTELEFLRNQHTALTAYNASQGAYDDQEQERVDLQRLGWTDDMTDENSVRRFLSRQLGKIVGAGGEADAMKEWEESLGGGAAAQAAIRQIAVNAKGQIGQGNKTYAALFSEKLDPATGRTTYGGPEAIDPTTGVFNNAAHVANMKKTMERWKDAGDVAVSKVKQASGTREGTGDFKLKVIVKEEAETNAALVKGWDSRSISSLDGGLLGDIDNSVISRHDLELQLKHFARTVKDQSAFNAVAAKLKKIIGTHGLTDVDLGNIYTNRNIP